MLGKTPCAVLEATSSVHHQKVLGYGPTDPWDSLARAGPSKPGSQGRGAAGKSLPWAEE